MKPKILVVGDPLYTVSGLAYVAGYMSKIFLNSELFESVAYFCLTGNLLENTQNEIRAIDNGNEELKDLLFYKSNLDTIAEDFNKTISEYRPHIVFSITDPWMTEPIAHSMYKSSYCWIAYTTVEVPKYNNIIFNPSCVFQNQPYKNILENLECADSVISVTKQGIDSLKNIRHKTIKLNNIYEENIYNGIEIDKRCTKKQSKSHLLNGVCKDDDFIFMTLGVNAERKKLENSILSFARFLEKIDNPKKYKLYLHANAHSSLGGPDLIAVAADAGCLNSIIGDKATTAVDKSKIYKYYNMCDCYIGFPGGEGFGYGFAEAMLHKKPLVYINYGGHSEYAHNGGLPAKVKNYVYAMRMGMKWGLVDVESASDQMVKIAKNEQLRNTLGNNGYEFVKNNFDWNIIKEKLLKAIFNIYENSPYKMMFGKNIKRII